eukprot:170891_1
MGCCSSGAAPITEPDERGKVANTEIGTGLKNAERLNKQAKKLLLLGTGSSGKSTLFKSLKIITKDQNMETETTEARHVIRQNCVAGILTLLKKSQELYDEKPEQNGACLVNMDEEIVSAIQLVVNYGSESFSEALEYNEVQELGRSIYMLWSLDAVRATFDRRGNTYSFPDNMDYFFSKVREIMMENYTPTVQDSLKCRVRTTGMIEYKYDIKDNEFILYDVGGQRNERKKWIHHFADVAAVLFVCALNHYHAVLFEDEKKNALHEAIELFTEICNSKWFRKSEMILFLNKDDLFREKLRLQIPLSTCFSKEVGWEEKQWDGPNYKPIVGDVAADKQHYDECYEAAIKFIQDAFICVNQFPNRVIFAHVTCATDQDTVQKVFWDVQNIVIRSNLRRGGLMV